MMPGPTTSFQPLPEEYQQVIHLAQDTYRITVAPLQLLVGGWSGAFVYLVSVSYGETRRVEHCILKLDHKSKTARSDEVTRHNIVIERSDPEFARDHIAELVFDRVEHEGATAIFYRIAGQSLLQYRPISGYGQESQLGTIFRATNKVLLEEWNPTPVFERAVHPQRVLERWLGFRLDAGGSYARNPEQWGMAALLERDIPQAQQPSIKSLRISQECGQTREMLSSLLDLASVDMAEGNQDDALRLIAIILNHPASKQSSLNRPESLLHDAEELRGQIEAQLDRSRNKSIWESGQKQRLTDVVAQILN